MAVLLKMCEFLFLCFLITVVYVLYLCNGPSWSDFIIKMMMMMTGRMVFKNPEILDSMQNHHLVPMQYVDDQGSPTMEYPLNPNGSPAGIAGLCSADGRHLAMMPHPERCVYMWQWPWMPPSWRSEVTVSPWLCMFKNAFDWCLGVNVDGMNGVVR